MAIEIDGEYFSSIGLEFKCNSCNLNMEVDLEDPKKNPFEDEGYIQPCPLCGESMELLGWG